MLNQHVQRSAAVFNHPGSTPLTLGLAQYLRYKVVQQSNIRRGGTLVPKVLSLIISASDLLPYMYQYRYPLASSRRIGLYTFTRHLKIWIRMRSSFTIPQPTSNCWLFKLGNPIRIDMNVQKVCIREQTSKRGGQDGGHISSANRPASLPI